MVCLGKESCIIRHSQKKNQKKKKTRPSCPLFETCMCTYLGLHIFLCVFFFHILLSCCLDFIEDHWYLHYLDTAKWKYKWKSFISFYRQCIASNLHQGNQPTHVHWKTYLYLQFTAVSSWNEHQRQQKQTNKHFKAKISWLLQQMRFYLMHAFSKHNRLG